MESLQENHDKRVFECFYPLSPSISDSICHCLFENKVNLHVLISRRPFNRDEDNTKTLIGMTNRGGQLIGFYLVFY